MQKLPLKMVYFQVMGHYNGLTSDMCHYFVELCHLTLVNAPFSSKIALRID